jgi:putative adhesin
MDVKTFWLGWRKDIFRFTALCLIALAVGLLINHARTGVHEGLTHWLPSGSLDGVTSGLDFDAPEGPRRTGKGWTYRARLSPGQSVAVRNMRGSITVEPARSDSLEVTAAKSFSGSDPGSVRVVAVPTSDGVAICALWGDREEGSRCGPGDDYKAGNAHDNDVGVQFTVRLPRGVRIRATTVTGAVRVTGATAPVVAGTVDGDVVAETTQGPVQAYSVNGSVLATVRGFGDTGAVKLTTVNGSVTLALPAELDATVSANTINGPIASDFPLTTTGKFVAHHAAGVIGDGGRRVELNAVNGSVRLKRIDPSRPR